MLFTIETNFIKKTEWKKLGFISIRIAAFFKNNIL